MPQLWMIEGDGCDGKLWYSETAESDWTDDRSEAMIFASEDDAHEFCEQSLDGSECIPCNPVCYEIDIPRI